MFGRRKPDGKEVPKNLAPDLVVDTSKVVRATKAKVSKAKVPKNKVSAEELVDDINSAQSEIIDVDTQETSQAELDKMEGYQAPAQNPLALPMGGPVASVASVPQVPAIAPAQVAPVVPVAPANPGVIVGLKVTESGLYESVIRSKLPIAELGQELNF